MKPHITREEASKLLVYDTYFEKGHTRSKIIQTTVALLGWIGVFLPFLWLALPLLFPTYAKQHHFLVYKEEVTTLKSLALFLGSAFLLIAMIFIVLTLWNNHQFKTRLQKETQYDEERLAIRRALLDKAYTQRFGPKEIRREVCYYSVKEEQNLATDFVRNLYKKGGVKL